MKLAFVVNSIEESGGLERVLSIKANALVHDYEVHIISLFSNTGKPFYEFDPRVHFHEVSNFPMGWRSLFGLRSKLKPLLKEIEPDVLTVCDDGLKGLFFPWFFGRLCPMVYERHASKRFFVNNKAEGGKGIKFWLLNTLSNIGGRAYDQLVVLTEGNALEWNTKNIKVIPNPLAFPIAETSNLSQKRVIAVGGHSHNKGYDRLLRSWQQIVAQYSDWTLHIYGRIRHQRIVNLAETLNLEENVHFHLPVNNIRKEYLSSALCVLSSRSEGFGMVLIEAMSCGVPCVAFNCPVGPKEIITHQEDGLLVDNGDEEAFAKAMLLLISNEELRNEYGKKAQENVERYALDKVMTQWDALYQSLKITEV